MSRRTFHGTQMNLEGIKDDAETMHALRNEIEGMKMLKHPNIVRLQEVGDFDFPCVLRVA